MNINKNNNHLNTQKEKDIKQGLQFEEEFLNHIKNKGNYIYQQNKFQDIDYMILNTRKTENNIYYVELKIRNIPKNKYSDTFIPLRKYSKALELIESGYKVYLIIRWTDFTGYIDFQKTPHSKIEYITSRWDRGEEEKGYYIYFNVKNFKEYNF